MAKRKVYAVRVGRQIGLFDTWNECRQHVHGYPGAKFKSFTDVESASAFLRTIPPSSSSSSITSRLHAEKNPASSSFSSSASFIEPRILALPSSFTTQTLNSETNNVESVSNALNHHSIKRNEHGEVIVFTDGSCLSNGRSEARAGYGAFLGQGHPMNISGRLPGSKQTNQRSELYAIKKLFEVLDSNIDIEIRSDSKYSIKTCTEWMPSWHKTEESKRKKYINLELMNEVYLESLHRKGSVRFTYVAAHIGIAGNEAADELAKAGALMNANDDEKI